MGAAFHGGRLFVRRGRRRGVGVIDLSQEDAIVMLGNICLESKDENTTTWQILVASNFVNLEEQLTFERNGGFDARHTLLHTKSIPHDWRAAALDRGELRNTQAEPDGCLARIVPVRSTEKARFVTSNRLGYVALLGLFNVFSPRIRFSCLLQ